MNIVLIGMMGAGKTTVGKELAAVLGWDFVDIDEEIEKQAGVAISEIFARYGEEYFRELEVKEIFRLTSQNNVISIGGGAFENIQTQEYLLENSTVIYLKAPVQTLINRIKFETHRPLAVNLAQLLQKREKNYEKAHFTIDAEQEISDIIKAIQGLVNV